MRTKPTALLIVATVFVPFRAGAQELPAKVPDLEIVLLADGGLTPPPQHYFILKVAASGEIDGGGDLNPGLPPPRRLPAAARAQLAALLMKERFFDLPRKNYGCAPDLGSRSIEARLHQKHRTISFCSDTPGLPVRDIQSLLRVWYGVLSGVAGAQGVPVSDADRQVLAKEP